MSNKLSRTATYTLADYVGSLARRHGVSFYYAKRNQDGSSTSLQARWTGEDPRPIKPGEWYLSGAVIEAYFSSKGTTNAFYPAEVVKITTRTVEEVVACKAVEMSS